ncbi:hypothetical protein DFH29DRAFT_1006390 [Suillus ampliporus]|nr:hypothetical protein DFH29DRAFT_1006390 [Suillus ampliporus]
MSAPRISDVPTMDKLTDLKLNHLIVEEEKPDDSDDSTQPLSYLLSRIFSTFTIVIPDTTELQVPLHKIRYRDARLHIKFAHLDEQSTVPLYDEDNCKWNWALPKSHHESGIDQLPEVEEIGDGEENSGTSQKPQILEDIFSLFFNAACNAIVRDKKKRNETMMANKGAVVHTWSSKNSTRPVKDDEVLQKPDLALLDDVEARWDTIKAVCELTSQLYKPTGMIGKTLDSKAYLLLRRQPWRQFVLLFSLSNEYCELRVHMYDHAGGIVTHPIHVDKAPNAFLHILLSVAFGHLECIGYDPSISIFTKTLRPAQLEAPMFRPSTRRQAVTDQTHDPQTDAQDTASKTAIDVPVPESISELDSDLDMKMSDSELDPESLPTDPPQLDIPQDPLCQPFSEPIGRITVNDHAYNILEVIFSSQGLVGRGTVCYLARRDDEEYIIKDHWVLGGKDVVLNKVNMLREMQGVCGVPELVEYWLVKIAPGQVDETMSY